MRTPIPWLILEDVIPDFKIVGIMNNKGDVVVPAKSIFRENAEIVCYAVNNIERVEKQRDQLLEAAKMALYLLTGSNMNKNVTIKKLEQAISEASEK